MSRTIGTLALAVALLLGALVAVAARIKAIRGPNVYNRTPATLDQESPPTLHLDCRALHPSECARTPGCVFYEHAVWPSFRSGGDLRRPDALVAELLREDCVIERLRARCQAEGIG